MTFRLGPALVQLVLQRRWNRPLALGPDRIYGCTTRAWALGPLAVLVVV